MFKSLSKLRKGNILIDSGLSIAVPYNNLRTQGDRHVDHLRLSEFWHNAWYRYVANCPEAGKVRHLLEKKEQKRPAIDHVAVRTFDLPNINKSCVGGLFERHGYLRIPKTLQCPDQPITADYFIHPDAHQPKVIVSELSVEQMPGPLRDWIRQATAGSRVDNLNSLLRPIWAPVDYKNYAKFCATSAYAVWVAAFGLQINHFAYLINPLEHFENPSQIDQWLKNNDLLLGTKISQDRLKLDFLSTTRISKLQSFSDGQYVVPGCSLGFVKRYPLYTHSSSPLFDGFLDKNIQ